MAQGEGQFATMLEFQSVYKKTDGVELRDINLYAAEGQRIGLECDHATSDLLTGLILGTEWQNRGSILLAGVDNREFLQKRRGAVGVIFREESFYPRMTVEAYVKFFAELAGHSVDVRDVLARLALLDSAKVKIHELNRGQRKRLALARERIKRPLLLLFQEPNLNMDRENMAILLDNLEQLSQEGTCVVNMSAFFRDTLLMGGQSYRLDDNGLVELQTGLEETPPAEAAPPLPAAAEPVAPVYRIEKIPARLEDRILLFDPMEIDFVESETGASALSVRGDRFPCALSMTELEERLRHFGFFRCHRSYLVNLQRLKEVVTFTRNSYSLSLDDRCKSSIPLSKGRLDELKEILRL